MSPEGRARLQLEVVLPRALEGPPDGGEREAAVGRGPVLALLPAAEDRLRPGRLRLVRPVDPPVDHLGGGGPCGAGWRAGRGGGVWSGI